MVFSATVGCRGRVPALRLGRLSPIAVYLGKTQVLETWIFLGVGLGWADLLAGAVALLWRKAALRITVQGG